MPTLYISPLSPEELFPRVKGFTFIVIGDDGFHLPSLFIKKNIDCPN